MNHPDLGVYCLECKAAVVSVGTRNTYNHPDPAWIGHDVLPTGCRMVCTQATERCQAELKADAAALREEVMALYGDHLAEPPWRHYRDPLNRQGPQKTAEVPCPGTVVIRLQPDPRSEPRILPTREAHERIVGRWETPLCRAQVASGGGAEGT